MFGPSPAVQEGKGLAVVRRGWLERVLALVRKLGTLDDLDEVLTAVTAAVTEVLGFGAAAMNVTTASGEVRVETVIGPPGVRKLLGTAASLDTWERLLAGCEEWGSLRFYSHNSDPTLVEGMEYWSAGGAPTAQLEDPEYWHPDDSLYAPFRDPTGALIGVLSLDQPMSGRKPDVEQRTLVELFAAEAAAAILDAKRQAEIRDRAIMYRAAFERIPAAAVIVDGDLRIVGVNDAFDRLIGRRASTSGEQLEQFIEAEDWDMVRRSCEDALNRHSEEITVEYRLRSQSAGTRWAKTSIGYIDSLSSGVRLVLNIKDVTDDRRAWEELRYRANHDTLTGLVNRRAVLSHLEEVLTHLDEEHPAMAVFFCDLDGFKQINDRYGHQIGDQVLSMVGQRLTSVLRPGDVLGRHGGDEFVIVALLSEPRDAVMIAERCVQAMVPPFVLGATSCEMSLSVGVAITTEPTSAPEELLGSADLALYGAKARGKSQWQLASVSGPDALPARESIR